jgi:3-methyladenine DNA glycosylase AlkD
MANVNELIAELKSHSNPGKAKAMQRFFKTGKGEYGEGDIFIGLSVPLQRTIARKYTGLSLTEIQKLLSSPIHEMRLTGLFILNRKYLNSSLAEKQKIFDFYLKNSTKINNWDLVDSSASSIVGNYLFDKPRDILFKLAKSKNIWERRIAMISTYAFIKNKDFKTTLILSEILLNDEHDLIHKAVGWMLKEISKKDTKAVEKFLDINCIKMPRTMLRYAIEKMPESKRRGYLKR